MLDGFKIKTVTPYGRKKYFEIQVDYLLKCRDIIDKHILWMNTNNKEDIDYAEFLVNRYPDFFETLYLPYNEEYKYSINNIHRFFDYSKDIDTVYVRIDDDIVWFDHLKFEDFVKYRIKSNHYFLLYANVINNSLCYYIHQKIGAIDCLYLEQTEYNIINSSWGTPSAAILSWQYFRYYYEHDMLERFKFKNWILTKYEPCSVNFCSWFGKDMAEVKNYSIEEENWLASIRPQEINKYNCIYGDLLAYHYAYGIQREVIDNSPEIIGYFNSIK